MLRSRWIPLGFFLVAGACATPPQQIPQAVTPVVTRFAYANGTAQYLYSSQRTIDQEVAGRSTRTETALRFLLSARVAQTGDLRSVRFSVDSILDGTGPGFTRAAQRSATGLTLEGTLHPTGEITGISDEGDRSILIANVTAGIKLFFPRIPVGGPEPGAEWVDTTSVVINDGSTRITKNSIVYSTAGEWLDDRSMLPITWRAEYTLEGEGQQMGQRFVLVGRGLTVGEHTLSADGFYVSTSARDSSMADVVLPTLGITVPIVQVGVDSVRIVR